MCIFSACHYLGDNADHSWANALFSTEVVQCIVLECGSHNDLCTEQVCLEWLF